MRKQRSFPKLERYDRDFAGGGKSHEKFERPLSSKAFIHLVMKSENARGERSFRHDNHRAWIKGLLKEMAGKFGVLILDYANVSTHLHLKLKIQNRYLFQAFLKAVRGQIAQRLKKPDEKFWTQSAFTRVLKSALECLGLKGYFEANRIEARCGYQAREDYRQAFNTWMQLLRKKFGASSGPSSRTS